MTNSRPFNPRNLHDLINQIEESPDDLIGLVKQFELDPKTDLVGLNLRGANLRGADLRGFSLERAQLQGANLRGAILVGSSLENANLRGADLSGAALSQAKLNQADLTEAKLFGANLEDSEMIEAQLVKADLRGASLQRADLTGSSMNHQLTHLDRVDFKDVILKDADLRQASLELTSIGDAKEVKGAKFGNNIGLNNDARRKLKKLGAELTDTSTWNPFSWIQDHAEPLKVIIAGLSVLLGAGGVTALVRWLVEVFWQGFVIN